jgi:hypothetical protein
MEVERYGRQQNDTVLSGENPGFRPCNYPEHSGSEDGIHSLEVDLPGLELLPAE